MEIEHIINNPWDNVYWFSRMLINSEKYGGLGIDSTAMQNVANAIYSVIDSKNRGDNAFDRWIGWAVIANNLITIANA